MSGSSAFPNPHFPRKPVMLEESLWVLTPACNGANAPWNSWACSKIRLTCLLCAWRAGGPLAVSHTRMDLCAASLPACQNVEWLEVSDPRISKLSMIGCRLTLAGLILLAGHARSPLHLLADAALLELPLGKSSAQRHRRKWYRATTGCAQYCSKG